MISFKNVSMTFPSGTKALQDVSFEVADNDFIFLVGPSGAGKTTILRLLLREQLPSAGTIMVNNVEISSSAFSKVQTYRKTIGVIFQDFKVLPNKPVYDNIALSS
jgi:cell division transport system ATP-binding protein